MRDIIADKEILTREEVMEILKIGRSTFYKLIQNGDLKGFKEGNRYKGLLVLCRIMLIGR